MWALRELTKRRAAYERESRPRDIAQRQTKGLMSFAAGQTASEYSTSPRRVLLLVAGRRTEPHSRAPIGRDFGHVTPRCFARASRRSRRRRPSSPTAAAGIAFALQNVILAVAGYFTMVAPNGIRIGDRVSLQGPFGYVHGEVAEIGFVRVKLNELGGEPLRPTGRVAVFPNSVVFTGTFFKDPPGAPAR
jgi:Mechanosensitive ion channel